MSNKIQKIVYLFQTLTLEEQKIVLKKLKTKSSISVSEFSQMHQQEFGTNVEFINLERKGPDHTPEISITLVTALGKFKGKGSNQKIAKANACAKAMEKMQ